MNQLESSENARVPKNFRRLQANELVSAGDFVADELRGLQLWEGPNGFRADSFIKAIYRRHKNSPADAQPLLEQFKRLPKRMA